MVESICREYTRQPRAPLSEVVGWCMVAAMLRLGTFRFDATPPVGCGTAFGLADSTSGVRDPLFARGFLLCGSSGECLVVQADWAGTMNRAHREIRAALADGAGLPEDRVAFHSSHQHDAPLFDFEIEALTGRKTFPRDWWSGLLDAARSAARSARSRLMPVSQVGHAETRLWGYASSRDVIGPDGRLLGNRWSRTREPEIVAAPVGTIDPMLRTVAFRGPAPESRLLGTISFYASHPQVASGSGRYGADAPGEAMRILSQALPTSDNAWCMGCAGNVTAGKYTSLTDLEGNLLRFGRRLADGILRNCAAMTWVDADDIDWKTASFPFPADLGKKESLRREMEDPAAPEGRKQVAAAVLTAMDDPGNETYQLNRLTVGGARVLFLPGEPFVEYQLFAQSLEPDRFVAVASNCSDNFLYLPRASSFALGGYEVQSYCWCTPEIEPRLERALREILS